MYALVLTKGNDEKVLFKSESKEEVIKEGDKIFKTLPKDSGLLNYIKADFDENGNIVDGKYRFYGAWHSYN